MRNTFDIVKVVSCLGEQSISVRNHYPEFEKVLAKTGIETVHSADVDAAELACRAARELLDQTEIDPQTVSAVLVVSQSPRYFLPGISSLVHAELGLSSNCITFDLNQGCSGFVQGLIVANGFVAQGRYVLLICTDTYRQKTRIGDRSTQAVFSDGATATLISAEPRIEIAAEEHFSDGSGRRHLFQRIDASENDGYLQMSGSDVYVFTKRVVEAQIRSAVAKAELSPSDIKVVFPHQASRLVLDELSAKLRDFREVVVDVEQTGNLVSSSIPYLLARRLDDLHSGTNVLAGFGVGLSASTVVLRGL